MSDSVAAVDVGSGAVRVFVVDDKAPFRAVARLVIDRTPGFVLAGEAQDGEDAVAAAEELHPDLVLMDINLPGMSGIEATRRIVARSPDTLVLLLSTYSSADLPASAATSGAAGYLHKEDFGPGELGRIWERRAAEID
jgi:DNA-binding NarL/FixJ family response regulator